MARLDARERSACCGSVHAITDITEATASDEISLMTPVSKVFFRVL